MILNFSMFKESIDHPNLVYDESSKSMRGIYKIISRDSEFITLENIQEVQEFKRGRAIIYMNDIPSGISYRRIIKLPTKSIVVGEEIGDGYFKISIPYYLYKINKSFLDIKKLDKSKFKMKNESITIPVDVGDKIYMGRFKNKETVIKKIGKDEHGMPTINGKKVVTFRKNKPKRKNSKRGLPTTS